VANKPQLLCYGLWTTDMGEGLCFEAEATYDCRGHVHEDALTSHLIAADVPSNHASHTIQAPALAAIGKGRLYLADENGSTIRERSARLEKPIVDPVNLAHLGYGKVVQRQARNDEIVNRFSDQVLDGGMNQFHLVAVSPKLSLFGETAVK